MRYSEITEALKSVVGIPLPEIGTYVKEPLEDEVWLVCGYLHREPYLRAFCSKERAAAAKKPELFLITPGDDTYSGYITAKPREMDIVGSCSNEFAGELRLLAGEFNGEPSTHAACNEFVELVHELWRRMDEAPLPRP